MEKSPLLAEDLSQQDLGNQHGPLLLCEVSHGFLQIEETHSCKANPRYTVGVIAA